MSVEFDFSEFNTLAVDIGTIAPGSEKTLRQAVEVNARRVKDGWNSKLYNDGHAKRTRGTISYDITGTKDGIASEIGPYVTRVQSGIVKLLENGSIHNPAHGYGGAALHENEQDLQDGVEKALGVALGGAGL